jgi:hypothetical protein
VISKLERLEQEFGKPTRTKEDYRRVIEKPAGTLSDLDIATIEFFAGEASAAAARKSRDVALGTRPRTPMTEKELAAVVSDAIKTACHPLWERARALERRIVELEARPTLRDAGVWQPGREYRNGDICTFQGGGWICRSAHVSVGTHPSPDAFRLFVKSGERK